MWGKGFTIHSPSDKNKVAVAELDRVWEDNRRNLWGSEAGQMGSVSGDLFVKVAWEDPTPENQLEKGRIKLVILDAAHCVDEETEILTNEGWKKHNEISEGTIVLTLDPKTDEIHWQPIKGIVKRPHKGKMYRWINKQFDSLTTDGHRWMTQNARSGKHGFKLTSEIHALNSGGARLVTAGGTSLVFAKQPTLSDELVELVAWFVTEGLAKGRTLTSWYLGANITKVLKKLCPDKQITPEFLCSLTHSQALLFLEILMLGDEHRAKKDHGGHWYQDSLERVDGFQMLCAMLGKKTCCRSIKHKNHAKPHSDVSIYNNRLTSVKELKKTEVNYDGIVWCPQVEATTWLARRNGITYWTGNCFPTWHPHNRSILTKFRIAYQYELDDMQGKKTRKRYTEVLTNDRIVIVDDGVRYEWPNGLGFIPVVHIRNFPIAGASYGLSDLNDFTQLNREINEKLTNVSDIINYHQAPVTVVYGAKASSMERGANKVWSGLPKDAKVENLELHTDLSATNNYIDKLMMMLYEIGGVPAGTIGRQQEVSNTSGVALHMLYQPLMEMRDQKILTYGEGLEIINKMILKVLEIKEGLDLSYCKNPYETCIKWPDPLPKDRLIMLQEVQQRMQMPVPMITIKDALKMMGVEDTDDYLKKIMQEKAEISAISAPVEGLPQSFPTNEKTGGENRPMNRAAAPSGMDTASGIGNAGGFIDKSTMTPQGASQSEMYSIQNIGPG